EAADWEHREADATQLLGVALSRVAMLPPKYADFAWGLKYYLTGAADSAVQRFRKAIDADSSWSGAWMALGEVFYHLLPREEHLDSLAEVAFLQARQLDPDFAPPLFHL